MGVLQTLSTLTVDIYLPAFPRIAMELSASDTQMQLTFSAAMVGMLFGGLAGGAISDAIGRRRMLLFAVLAHTIASIACGLSATIEILIVARAGQGIAAAALSVVVLASARDRYSGRAMVRALAMIAIVSGLAIAAGPAIGALMLTVMTWRAVFLVLAGYALLLGAIILTSLKETLEPPARQSVHPIRLLRTFGLLLKDRLFLGLSIVGGFVWAGQYGYLASSSLIFQTELGLDESGYSLVFASHALFMLVGNQLGAMAAQRTSPARLLLVSTAILVVSTGLLIVSSAMSSGLTFVLPCLWLFTLALGATNPCLQSLALARHGAHAGAASSVLSSASLALGALAAPIASFGGVATLQRVAVVMFACQLIAMVAMLAVVRPATGHIQKEWSAE